MDVSGPFPVFGVCLLHVALRLYAKTLAQRFP